jgi:hypothetical protein
MVKAAVSEDEEPKSETTAKASAIEKPKAPKSANVDFTVLVEEAYLRTLSRFPTQEESKIALEAIEGASDPMNGLRDVLWALLNTKEFIVNH